MRETIDWLMSKKRLSSDKMCNLHVACLYVYMFVCGLVYVFRIAYVGSFICAFPPCTRVS